MLELAKAVWAAFYRLSFRHKLGVAALLLELLPYLPLLIFLFVFAAKPEEPPHADG